MEFIFRTLEALFSSWSIFLSTSFFHLLPLALFVGITFLFLRIFRGF